MGFNSTNNEKQRIVAFSVKIFNYFLNLYGN